MYASHVQSSGYCVRLENRMARFDSGPVPPLFLSFSLFLFLLCWLISKFVFFTLRSQHEQNAHEMIHINKVFTA